VVGKWEEQQGQYCGGKAMLASRWITERCGGTIVSPGRQATLASKVWRVAAKPARCASILRRA